MAGWLIAVALGAITFILMVSWDRFMRMLPKRQHRSVGQPVLPKAIIYDVYFMSARERLAVILVSGTIMGMIGFVFYKSVVLSLAAGLTGFCFPRLWRNSQIRRRKGRLLLQFRQALFCISSALTAGKSAENAFRDALCDLRLLYIDPHSLIVREFEAIVQRLDNGETLEHAVADFASRANEQDVTSFFDVLATCKRTGGNLVEVMRRSAAIIGEKLEIQADIAVLLAQKRFEARVLTGAPVLIVAVLSFTSGDYMEPLFQGFGRIVMTAGLIVLGLCFWFSQKMMRISV